MRKNIVDLWKRDVGTDTVIHVKGKLFKAHKLVLAAVSPFFEAIYYGPMSKESDIDLSQSVDSRTFELYLNYVYRKEYPEDWRDRVNLYNFCNYTQTSIVPSLYVPQEDVQEFIQWEYNANPAPFITDYIDLSVLPPHKIEEIIWSPDFRPNNRERIMESIPGYLGLDDYLTKNPREQANLGNFFTVYVSYVGSKYVQGLGPFDGERREVVTMFIDGDKPKDGDIIRVNEFYAIDNGNIMVYDWEKLVFV